MSERSRSKQKGGRSEHRSSLTTEADQRSESSNSNGAKRRFSNSNNNTTKDAQRRSRYDRSQEKTLNGEFNYIHQSTKTPHVNGRKKIYSPNSVGDKSHSNSVTSPVMDSKRVSRREHSPPLKSTKRRTHHENGMTKNTKQRNGHRESRPPFDNSTRVIRNKNEFQTSEINFRGNHSNEDTDIEVQDWVVKKLNLSNSKLTEKDLNRISVMVTVYCNVSIDIKKVLAKYKKEDIFKQSKQEKVASYKRGAASEKRTLDEESTSDDQEVPQCERETSPDGEEESQTESLHTSEIISTPYQQSPSTLDSNQGTAFANNEPVPSTSTSETGLSELSTDFEPTPGCSKDPDTPPRTRIRPKSEPLPGAMDDIVFEPLPSTSKQTDEQVEQKTRASKKPRRKVRLAPALPDMMNEPPRGVAISSIAEEEEEEEVPGKVKVDADMMEVALIILLATKRRKKELQALMASY